MDEPEPAAGVAAATDMAPDSDAAVAGEGVEEEAGVDEDQPEDLDFNIDAALDEALDAVAEPAGEPAAETEEAAEGDLLEDLDLELDMDAEPEAGDEAAGVKAVEDGDADELDLSSLDEILDMDTEPAGEAVPEAEDTASEDTLEDLDLDLDMETAPDADKEAEADELDMSDIKFELGEYEASDVEGAEDAEELDLELELEMEDDGKTKAELEDGDVHAKDVEEEVEDLDFELDMEFASDDDLEGAELALASEGTEELDMSDIEQLLEVKDGDIPGIDMVGSDLDQAPEVEKWKDTPGEKKPGEDTAEIDLSDIDLDAENMEDIEIEDQELELDLDEETIKSAEAIASGKKLIDEPQELDISKFEDLAVEKKDVAGVLSEGDIELEFEMEGYGTDGIAGEATSDVVEPTQQLDTIVRGGSPPGMPQKTDDADAEKPEKKKAQKKKVKRTRPVGKSSPAKPVLVILLLLVIAFGAVVVLDRYVGMEIPYVTEYVRQIPYVNQLMKPDMMKAGEITTANINSRFVDNGTSGRLFVITGKVKNEFPESRRFIKLTGRLFASGKVLVKEETIYCGNTLTDIQLGQMAVVDINKKLSNRFGDQRSNVDVKPGQELPFMVVFSDFPQDLEEFTIEVVGSSPAQQ